MAEADAQSPALADGVVLVAVVLSEFLALGIDDGAWGGFVFGGTALGDDAGIVLIGDETDFLAVGFVEDGQVALLGHGADGGLVFKLADGQEHAIEAMTGRAEQDVGLILVQVTAPGEMFDAVDGLDAGVVAGGDIVGVDAVGVFEEFAELEPIIATDAWIGGSACVVFADEIINDAIELLFEIEHVQRDVEHGRDQASVGCVIDRATALLVRFIGVTGGAVFGFGVGSAVAHETADDLITLLLEYDCRRRAVDAAAHGEEDFFRWAGFRFRWAGFRRACSRRLVLGGGLLGGTCGVRMCVGGVGHGGISHCRENIAV